MRNDHAMYYEKAYENCFSTVMHNMNYALYEIVEDELVFDLTDHKKVNRDGFFLFPTSQEEVMTS